MKSMLFWLLILLNFLALAICVMWIFTHQTYESVAVAVTLCANLVAVVYTKPHWNGRRPHRTVTQFRNIAGGDIAGGNITKNGEPPSAA